MRQWPRSGFQTIAYTIIVGSATMLLFRCAVSGLQHDLPLTSSNCLPRQLVDSPLILLPPHYRIDCSVNLDR